MRSYHVLDIRQYDVLVTVVRVRYVLIICTYSFIVLMDGKHALHCMVLDGSKYNDIHNYTIISNLRMRKKLQKKVRHNE